MWLAFERVTKFYGPVIGVNDINCRLGPGITGLLGANGAGKSTLLKLASGQLRPSQGRILVGDHSAWSSAAKRQVGFCPDLDRFYEEMTGREFVYTMTRLSGYPIAEARHRTAKALAQVGMTQRGDRHLAGCSHGMRQRIKLAQALVHDPPVLLLDEPMTGIDPAGRHDISELLRELAQQGKTILISSHILDEVEHVADSFLIIARGRLIASGTLGEVRNLLEDQPFTVEVVADAPRRLAALLVELPEVLSVALRGDVLSISTRHPQHFFAALGDIVLDRGVTVRQMSTLDSSATAVFGYLQGGAA